MATKIIGKIQMYKKISKWKGTNEESSFVNLPHIVISNILEFLEPKERIIVLMLSESLYYLLMEENLANTIIKEGLGMKYISNIREFNDFNYDWIQKFKSFISYKSHINLPFYGFESNGGMEGDLDEYWISLAFTKGCWSHCTKAGHNFLIKGAITRSYEYLEPDLEMFIEMLNWIYKVKFQTSEVYFHMLTDLTRMIPRKEKLLAIFDNFQMTKYSCIRRLLRRFFKRKFEDRFCIVVKNISRKKKMPPNVIIQKFSTIATLIDKNELYLTKIDNYKVRESVSPNYDKISIITSFEFSRKGMFTCPVRTFLVFASLEEIDVQTEIFSLFDDINTYEKLDELIIQQRLILPSLKETNIRNLANHAQYFCRKTKFRHFRLDNRVKPMIWGQFNSETDEVNLKLNFGNFFAARFIYVKLIDCENKMVEMLERDFDSNIDFNFFQMKGLLLNKSQKDNGSQNGFPRTQSFDSDYFHTSDDYMSEGLLSDNY